jgi:signal transduction histidine kinase
VTADGGVLRLQVSNDGVIQRAAAGELAAAGEHAAAGQQASGGGRGLANLNARVRAAGGRLASQQAGDRFDLVAEIPLGGSESARARLGHLRGMRPGLLPAERAARTA